MFFIEYSVEIMLSEDHIYKKKVTYKQERICLIYEVFNKIV